MSTENNFKENMNEFDFVNNDTCFELDFNELNNFIDNISEKEKLLFKAKKTEREFTKNLIKLRKNKGLTQVDMANRTGLTQQAISTLEKCDRKPTLFNLIRYLLGLGVDINTIFKENKRIRE